MRNMKKYFFTVIWASFFLVASILLNEFFYDVRLGKKLSTEPYGLPPDSKSLEMATKDKGFSKSQFEAIKKRLLKIPGELLRNFCVLVSSFLFLDYFIRRALQNILNKAIMVIPKARRSTSIKEIAYTSVVVTTILAAAFGSAIIVDFVSKGKSVFATTILFYLAICLFAAPSAYLILNKLLKIYSSKLIIACYLAYFVKTISDFMSIDDVNLAKMEKVDISIFSNEVIDYLKERGLEKRVYSEIGKKSDSLNAALVGWGSFERIEIYGEHKDLTDREFESILMHEIGHSQHYSLLKKMGMLFMIKAVEMLLVLKIYTSVAEKYTDDLVTRNASFAILFLLYYLFVNRWLLILHKATSQVAEMAADNIAKAHGYGKELSKVLYDITIHNEFNLRATHAFNIFKSYHPTVYNRIEYLNS